MKRLFVAMLFGSAVVTGVTIASAQGEGELRVAPQTRVYIIERGDTLWDISASHLNSPWSWPRIWHVNPHVTNPHLIFPGQQLTIPGAPRPGDPVARTEPQPAAGPALEPVPERVAAQTQPRTPERREAPAEDDEMMDLVIEHELPDLPDRSRLTTAIIPMPKQERYYVRLGSEGFVDDRFEPVAAIVGAHSLKQLYSEGDAVFVSLGEGSGVQPGQMFTVFSTEESVKHPHTGDHVGYRTRQLGEIEIMTVQQDVSTARVTRSYDAIGKGSYLRPFEAYERRIYPQPNPQINGVILTPTEGMTLAGEHNMVYLDQGRQQIQIGEIFEIYRPVPDETDPLTGRTLRLPEEILGAGIVIDVRDHTSTALVWDSRNYIEAGDRIRTLQMN